MNRLRKSFRRSKEPHVPECSKPHQWESDEKAVRSGTCNFHVKYLGCIEVYESRGMPVCEEALHKLKNSGRKKTRAVLWVTADALRVVDEDSKGLIVDQTIEKVSFCAPDRTYERGFSYICRDGTTRRWMCHGFIAIKDSGERLSHAVGCAFAACLERKQKREKDCGVTVTWNADKTSFTRQGSFRQTTMTERMDQEELDAEAQGDAASPGTTAKASAVQTAAIPRQQAPLSTVALQRQGSFRFFPKLSSKSSPFKRQLSLRLNELPSNLQRKEQPDVAPAAPPPPANEVAQPPPTEDSISAMCKMIQSDLFTLSSTDDPFTSMSSSTGTVTSQQQTVSQFLTSTAKTVAHQLQPIVQAQFQQHRIARPRPKSRPPPPVDASAYVETESHAPAQPPTAVQQQMASPPQVQTQLQPTVNSNPAALSPSGSSSTSSTFSPVHQVNGVPSPASGASPIAARSQSQTVPIKQNNPWAAEVLAASQLASQSPRDDSVWVNAPPMPPPRQKSMSDADAWLESITKSAPGPTLQHQNMEPFNPRSVNGDMTRTGPSQPFDPFAGPMTGAGDAQFRPQQTPPMHSTVRTNVGASAYGPASTQLGQQAFMATSNISNGSISDPWPGQTQPHMNGQRDPFQPMAPTQPYDPFAVEKTFELQL
ncbi:protein numb-like isoform X2 [Branchiostoma lanceolatum]|uniref:protein numb-like isoform X2 n=1 Tax=Branchiostoma lanceolatum TaxID=7740 RepID=UPI0034553456